jgi:hypothetical protein
MINSIYFPNTNALNLHIIIMILKELSNRDYLLFLLLVGKCRFFEVQFPFYRSGDGGSAHDKLNRLQTAHGTS